MGKIIAKIVTWHYFNILTFKSPVAVSSIIGFILDS